MKRFFRAFAIFRRGKRHSNYGRDVEKMIRLRPVKLLD